MDEFDFNEDEDESPLARQSSKRNLLLQPIPLSVNQQPDTRLTRKILKSNGSESDNSASRSSIPASREEDQKQHETKNTANNFSLNLLTTINSAEQSSSSASSSVPSSIREGRTKSQRLKALQSLSPGQSHNEQAKLGQITTLSTQTLSSQASWSSASSRRVQFSNAVLQPMIDGSSTNMKNWNSLSQPSSSSSQSVVSKQRKRRHPSSSRNHNSATANVYGNIQRVGSSIQDKESDEDNITSVLTSNSKRTKHIAAARPRNRQHQQLLQSVGLDVFAVQDTGHSQMLQDECIFLCSSVKEGMSSSQTSCLSALEAASNLIQILSKQSNRYSLFFHNPCEDNPALQSMLDLFGATGMWSCHQQYGAVADYNHEESQQETYGDSQLSELSIAGVEDRSCRTRRSQLQQDAPTGEEHELPPDTVSLATIRSLLQAVTIVLHFASMDCTLSQESASGNGKMARKMRLSILSHAHGFQGILRMALADPLVSRFRLVRTLLSDTFTSSPSIVPSQQLTWTVTRTKQSKEVTSVTNPPILLSVGRVGTNSQDSIASSSCTPDSQSSCSADPTKAGRRRRKRRHEQQQQLETISNNIMASIPEEDRQEMEDFIKKNTPDELSFRTHDDFSVTSKDSQVSRLQQQLETTTDQILQSCMTTCPVMDHVHSCDDVSIVATNTRRKDITCSSLVLLAITRIITGKMEGDDKACIDEMDEHDEFIRSKFHKGSSNRSGGGSINNGGPSTDVDEDEDSNNPLLVTNKILGENGAITLLSQAFAETLVAVSHQVVIKSSNTCMGCMGFLKDRITMLGSLVDGACLLNDKNRKVMVQEGYTKESGGYLIFGLVMVLRSLLDKDILFESNYGDITVEVLRALTSLTHDNMTAAKELESHFHNNDNGGSLVLSLVDERKCVPSCGLELLAYIIQNAVVHISDSMSEKSRYDSTIFCLNIFTNTLESETTRQFLSALTIPDHNQHHRHHPNAATTSKILFLTWLTQWLVQTTQSFQDALVESTFGTSPSKHSSRHLVNDENERLVTAGNGFVLLSCLMIDEGTTTTTNGGGTTTSTTNTTTDSTAHSSTTTILLRTMILQELPGRNELEKITFMKNTLKAFCNFYHFSVGDLSLAIVAPIKMIISKLETMMKMQ